MVGILIVLALIVPGVLALALPVVKPDGLAWFLWSLPVLLAVGLWIWAASMYPDGNRIFYFAFAAWTSLWPLVALAIRLMKRKDA
jgi:hypothetical protein